MALAVERAVAELLHDGDPARSIDGLASLEGFKLYDDSPTTHAIFVAEERPDPDEAVTVVIEGGAAPIPGAYGQGVGRQPAFSIRTRSASYDTGTDRAQAIHRLIDEYEGTKHGVPFFRINANTEPIPLGRDSENSGGRWIWTQTFRSITKRFEPS